MASRNIFVEEQEVTARGWNGNFNVALVEVFKDAFYGEAQVDISSSRYGKTPPIRLRGKINDVTTLLREIVDTLEQMEG